MLPSICFERRWRIDAKEWPKLRKEMEEINNKWWTGLFEIAKLRKKMNKGSLHLKEFVTLVGQPKTESHENIIAKFVKQYGCFVKMDDNRDGIISTEELKDGD